MHTSERIERLGSNQIFIFGSNILGNHFGGAAKQAYDLFSAEWGVGEGMTGQCYAFPTLDQNMEKRSEGELQNSIEELYFRASLFPEKEFLLTKVGCGIAGYDEEYMKQLFRDSPENIIKPFGW